MRYFIQVAMAVTSDGGVDDERKVVGAFLVEFKEEESMQRCFALLDVMTEGRDVISVPESDGGMVN